MADPLIQNEGTETSKTPQAQNSGSRNPVRSACFKYYIHDGVDSCRLQLIGEFTETEVPNLDGCWNCVKTTINGRKFVLDLEGLDSTEDAAKAWIIRMTAEGAIIRPENFLLDGPVTPKPSPVRNSIRARVLSLLRGSSAVGA
jgi:hypothetical protein